LLRSLETPNPKNLESAAEICPHHPKNNTGDAAVIYTFARKIGTDAKHKRSTLLQPIRPVMQSKGAKSALDPWR
jgi:hypothetical protein